MQRRKGGKLKYIIIGVVAIIILGGVFGGDKKDKDKTKESNKPVVKTTEQTAQEPEEVSEERTEFAVGETVDHGGIEITLVNVSESGGSEFLQPNDGNTYLLLEFEITNHSEKDISISSIANFEAYYDDTSVNQDIGGLQAPEIEGKNQLDGSVAVGKRMNGVIAYQVPADYTKFEISVAPDFWSSKEIKFVVTK